MVKKRGEGLIFISIIFVILIVLILNGAQLGMFAYSKDITNTASREGARAYAVEHSEDLARNQIKEIVSKTLYVNEETFPGENVELSEITHEDQPFCKARVSYNVPVIAPDILKILNPKDPGWGRFKKVTSSAYFLKEYQPEEELDEE
ncbi:hypothetical protein [Desulforamulus reducens]|nr:hypothetical protein [Desulforamulus reducens]